MRYRGRGVLALEGSLHAAHRGQGLRYADVGHAVHEAFGNLFGAHACDVHGGLDVAGELRLHAIHRS